MERLVSRVYFGWLAVPSITGNTEILVSAHGTLLIARPRSACAAQSVTFCHGLAGVLQIALRFSEAMGNHAGNIGLINGLIAEILLAFEPRSCFGYSDTLSDGTHVQRPGVLEGAAGVLLVLLSVTSDVDPAWDRVFGIA